MSQQQRKAPTSAPTGQDYRATARLSDKANQTLAAVGETCERVPAASWPWLIDQGLMVPVEG